MARPEGYKMTTYISTGVEKIKSTRNYCHKALTTTVCGVVISHDITCAVVIVKVNLKIRY